MSFIAQSSPRGAAALLAGALGLAALALPAVAAEDGSLRARIEAFVRSRAPEPPDAVRVPSLAAFEELAGREGVEVSLSASAQQRFVGAAPVTISLEREGRELKRGVVTTRVEIRKRALVAARNLAPGESLREGDLRFERVPLSELPEDWTAELGEVVGLRTERAVAAGHPLRSRDLEEAPAVARGEVVHVVLRRGGLRIETRGVARADGRPGDRIRVQNTDSGREMRGVVQPGGEVHVDF